MTNAKIVNCKKAGIRSNPTNPHTDEDTIGTIPAGDIIKIDSTKRYYDWKDNGFYACDTPIGEGYINVELVEEL